MYKWYFRIVDDIYHVLDSWDKNGFVVFLLSCFHSDDYNWKTVTDVINRWPQLSEVDINFPKTNINLQKTNSQLKLYECWVWTMAIVMKFVIFIVLMV